LVTRKNSAYSSIQYPRENDYNEVRSAWPLVWISELSFAQYLSSNSGQSNAFTGLDQTTYYFDVHPDALDGALDRFSQFFIAPLFDPSCTEREIQAVDSENKKNLQSDMWRLYQLEKSLSSRDHAYWRFGTGNLDTLWKQPRAAGLDVRDELLKFHQRHYSANLMKLAIIGKRASMSMHSQAAPS
jgi:insulysin